MNSSKNQQPAGIASSDNVRDAQKPTVPATRKKRWHVTLWIALLSLGVAAVVLCFLRSSIISNYFGIGVALCFAICGIFLVRHAIRMFLEEDRLQESQLKENGAKISSPEANNSGQQTDSAARTPESEENIKKQTLNQPDQND